MGKTESKKTPRISGVEPILDKDFIDKYLARDDFNGNSIPGMYTLYKGSVTPYCTPSTQFVCRHCGLISNNGRTMEEHHNICNNVVLVKETDTRIIYNGDPKNKYDKKENDKRLNYIKLELNGNQIESLNSIPKFGWFKRERFLVLNKGYTYACLCGVGYSNTTRLSRHFRECTYINDIYCTTKGSENSLLFDNDNPIVSRITGWCGGVLNTSSALVTYNKLESGFSEKNRKRQPQFLLLHPRQEGFKRR